ncbi:hypothetical protein M2145_001688 [Lachnospiraceae bacterium PF1-21]|uniref:hypothetical protein n=1 Tax=Ohessyouella blattaphilus TaxID=2949333 RepID=UPI003E192453
MQNYKNKEKLKGKQKRDLSKLSTEKGTKKVDKIEFSRSYPHYPQSKGRFWGTNQGKKRTDVL